MRLIDAVHASLTSLALSPAGAPETRRRTPSAPVRSSVKSDRIVRLVCGRKLRLLRRHIGAAHALSPETYRDAFGLSDDCPMMLPGVVIGRPKQASGTGGAEASTGGASEADDEGSPASATTSPTAQPVTPQRGRLTISTPGKS